MDRIKVVASLIASTVSGLLEILFFHPVDTTIKRLMVNTTSIKAKNWLATVSNLSVVIFNGESSHHYLKKIVSLFSGLGCATVYKVAQRVYKFSGQPLVKELISDKMGPAFDRQFRRYSKSIQHGLAGAIIGIGEVILIPLDALKILKQTSRKWAEKSILDILSIQRLNLYRGVSWTAARNLSGSCLLFGASAYTKDSIFCLQNHSDATVWQILASSTIGTLSCILMVSPLDVVKTRIQVKMNEKIKGREIAYSMLRKEGVGSFWKGSLPKIFICGPKLIFSLSATQYLSSTFEKSMRTVTHR